MTGVQTCALPISSHLAHRIVEDTGYVRELEQENTAEADARIENIKELVGSIGDFEEEAEVPSLDNFLELVALQTDVDAANFNTEQVTLMTVHAAKGLEFDAVFVTGLEEGLFPLIRQGEAIFTDSEELDEERRLGYVAMTRARKKLFLTRARTRKLFGNTRTNPPSRFIANVPAAITKNLTPDEPTASLFQRGAPKSTISRRSGANWGSAGRSRPSSEVWVDTSFDQSAQTAPNVMPGQEVSHPRFGKGKVIGIHPGAKPKADIQFPGFGKKTILVKYLELE